MTNNEIINAIDKLRYQMSIISQTIDSDKYPVEALIMHFEWGPGDIDKAHDIFEEWDRRLEQGEKINSFEFEKQFEEKLNISYQGLKSVILAFYDNGQWTNVCEAYVDSFGRTPALEYHRIMRRER